MVHICQGNYAVGPDYDGQIGHRYFDAGRYKADLICKIDCDAFLIEHDMTPHYEGLFGRQATRGGRRGCARPECRDRRASGRADQSPWLACARTDHHHQFVRLQSPSAAYRFRKNSRDELTLKQFYPKLAISEFRLAGHDANAKLEKRVHETEERLRHAKAASGVATFAGGFVIERSGIGASAGCRMFGIDDASVKDWQKTRISSDDLPKISAALETAKRPEAFMRNSGCAMQMEVCTGLREGDCPRRIH